MQQVKIPESDLINGLKIALGKNEWELAKDICLNGIENYPSNHVFYECLAFVFLSIKEYEKSYKFFCLTIKTFKEISKENEIQFIIASYRYFESLQNLQKVKIELQNIYDYLMNSRELNQFVVKDLIKILLENQYHSELVKILKYRKDVLGKYNYLIDSIRDFDQTSQSVSSQRNVEGLFDQYSSNFEKSLVDNLDYNTPEIVADEVCKIFSKKLNILDLGCGTGLFGKALKNKFTENFNIDGVDLSQKMLEEAFEKNIYRNLTKSEINEFLESLTIKYELIISLDVFVYIGKIDSILSNAYKSLNENGIFIFSTELHEGDDVDYTRQISHRFAHSNKYVNRVSIEAGFEILDQRIVFLRKENTGFIEGGLYFLKKN